MDKYIKNIAAFAIGVFVVIVIFILIKPKNTPQESIHNAGKKQAVSAEKQDEAMHRFNECKSHYNNKRYIDADRCYANLISKYDRNEFRYERAKTLVLLNRKNQAYDILLYIIKNEKTNRQTFYDAQSLMKKLSRKDSRYDIKQEILEKDKKTAEEQTAEAQKEQSDNIFDSLFKNGKEQEEAKNCLEIYNQNNFYEAYTCFSRMADKYNSNLYRYNSAMALTGLGRYGEAKDLLNYISSNETKNRQLLQDTEKLSKEIEEMQSKQFEKEDREKCYDKIKNEQYDSAQICLDGLIAKYDNNIYRYDKARISFIVRDYFEAKTLLEYIIKNEKQDTHILELSKELLENTNKIIAEREDASRRDYGDYEETMEYIAVWPVPQKIKVYIDDNHPKSYLLKNAFDAWDNAAQNEINFIYVANRENADITARISDISEINQISQKPNDYDGRSFETAGITNSKKRLDLHSKEYYLVNADVLVSKNSGMNSKLRSDRELYAIALHEVGHALGLQHSNEKSDIMYPNNDSFAQQDAKLSRRDINTLRQIYEK